MTTIPKSPEFEALNALSARLGDGTDVLVLGNHGLVVAADSVAGAELLLEQATAALAARPRSAPPADREALECLALDSNYQLPEDPALHALGTDPASCRIAAAGSLYPDHVIFLGNTIPIARPGQTARDMEQAACPLLVFPGKGVLVARHASASTLAMARCLADVASRIPPATAVRALTDTERAELLGWDAEKYRKSLNAGLPEETP